MSRASSPALVSCCRRLSAALALTAGLLLAGPAPAQQPQPDSQVPNPRITSVFPPGGKVGSTVEVTVTGTDIEEPQTLLFSHPGLKTEPIVEPPPPPPDPKNPPKQPPKRNQGPPPTTARFKIVIAADTPLGAHDVRLVGKWGVSNPRAFVVGDLAEVVEKEPNDDVAQAQRVELNTTVNGVIGTPTDVDYFVFAGKKGQRVVFSCAATSIDSNLEADIEVYDARARLLAMGRFYQEGDALTDCTLAADGDVTVRLCRFTYTSGGPDHFYRLSITTAPWIDAVFPSVVEPGKSNTLTVYGRNLPGGVLDPTAVVDGRVLEKATMVVNVPSEPGALGRLTYSGRLDPTTVTLHGMEYRVHNAAGTSNAVLLTFARAPVILEAASHNTPETAQEVVLPCEIAGRIEKRRDRDWYAFTAKKGDVYRIELLSHRLGAPTDIKFIVYNGAKQSMFEAQDNGDQVNPKFYSRSPDPAAYRFQAPADGKYLVLVKSLTSEAIASPRQFYRLRITPEQSDFQLVVMPPADHLPDACRLPQGGQMYYTVFAFRADDWKGDIALGAEGLPKGVTCPPQTLAENLRQMPFVLCAAADAGPWNGPIKVVGTATINGQKVVREARYASITWPVPPQQNIPTVSRLDRTLVLAVREAAPYELTATLDKPVLKQGEKGTLTLKVKRAADFKAPVVVQALDLPAPIIGVNNNQPLTIAADKTDGTLVVEIKANTAPGTYNLVLRSQAQMPFNKDPMAAQKPPINVVLPSPPVTITVLPKAVASVSASIANANVKPGASAEVVIKVSRQFEYAGDFKVQLVLPESVKGLSAGEVVIPAGKDEGKLVVTVAADAAAGPRADLVVRATAVLNGNVPVTQETKITLTVVK